MNNPKDNKVIFWMCISLGILVDRGVDVICLIQGHLYKQDIICTTQEDIFQHAPRPTVLELFR